MVQKVVVNLIDDIDESDAAETVTFGLDGVTYQIDLSEENAAKLRAATEPWTKHARRVSGNRGASGSTAKRSSGARSTDARAIREWAAQAGMETSGRGRIPAEVRAAYEAAH